MVDILDTNVLLRFLVGDDASKQKQAEKWFAEGEKGKRKIIVKVLVVAEACFVLESFYKKKREKVSEALEVFLSQRWLQVEEREVLLDLWTWYKEGLHFVDCFLLAWAKINKANLLTFDHQLQKLGGVT